MISPDYGIEWVQEGLYIGPRWTVEPDLLVIEDLVRNSLHIPVHESCLVTFLEEGQFNKIYKVEVGSRRYVMRVALPIEIPYKVKSEVATTLYLERHTSIPVPRLYAYDSSNHNALRFAWILMDFIDEECLYDAWRSLDWSVKEDIIKTTAIYVSEVFQKRFARMGSLQITAPIPTPAPFENGHAFLRQLLSCVSISLLLLPPACVFILFYLVTIPYAPEAVMSFALNRVVSLDYVWNEEIISRGPFDHASSWLYSRLLGARTGHESGLSAENPEEVEHHKSMLNFITRLENLIPRLFPLDSQPERFALWLHDFHFGNMMVDKAGKIVVIIDWECVSTVPLWAACQLPKFLDGPDEVKPVKENYLKNGWRDDLIPENITDEEIWDGYYDDLDSYHLTILRKTFLSEMERMQPDWADQYHKGKMRREFVELLRAAEVGSTFNKDANNIWLDHMEKGKWKRGALWQDFLQIGDEGYELVFEIP